jgi:DNA-binding NarL/FixJ family response regulator
MRARILVADDHPVTLAGISAVLQPHHDIVGTATDGRALVGEAERLKPDLIVLDISMPLLNGIDAAAQIKKSLPDTKFLFITMQTSPAYVNAVLDAGGTGYVLKSSAGEELLTAVDRVLAGTVYITPRLLYTGPESGDRPRLGAALSAREREILQMIAEGKLAKEIAFILNISVKTVAFHREKIKAKLGVRSTAELTKYAIENRLISI